MVEPIRPNPTKKFGRENWIIVLTYANINALTAAEINAASALDVSRIVFADSGRPTQTTNRVQAERRLGDDRQGEFIGVSTVTGGTMTYAFGAQDAALSDGKKLYEKIPAGTTAALVERVGVTRATTPAAGQFYNAYAVEFGPSFPATVGQGESAESAMTAEFAIPNPDLVAINKAIV
jgi:hypothetical protein